jgi:hypothetical protein
MARVTMTSLRTALRSRCDRSGWSFFRARISSVWKTAEMATQTTKTPVPTQWTVGLRKGKGRRPSGVRTRGGCVYARQEGSDVLAVAVEGREDDKGGAADAAEEDGEEVINDDAPVADAVGGDPVDVPKPTLGEQTGDVLCGSREAGVVSSRGQDRLERGSKKWRERTKKAVMTQMQMNCSRRRDEGEGRGGQHTKYQDWEVARAGERGTYERLVVGTDV